MILKGHEFPRHHGFDCTSIYIPIDELTFERKFSLYYGGTQSILSLLRPPTHVGKLPLSMRIGIVLLHSGIFYDLIFRGYNSSLFIAFHEFGQFRFDIQAA